MVSLFQSVETNWTQVVLRHHGRIAEHKGVSAMVRPHLNLRAIAHAITPIPKVRRGDRVRRVTWYLGHVVGSDRSQMLEDATFIRTILERSRQRLTVVKLPNRCANHHSSSKETFSVKLSCLFAALNPACLPTSHKCKQSLTLPERQGREQSPWFRGNCLSPKQMKPSFKKLSQFSSQSLITAAFCHQ